MEKQEHATLMDVLLIKPNEFPQPIQIEPGLKSMQQAVGGYIEAVYPFEDPVAIICNEEGKMMGLPLNRALRDDDGDIYDVLAGDVLIVGLTEDDFGSLTPEQMKTYEEKFHSPETFVRMGRGIIAIPIPDEAVEQKKTKTPKQKEASELSR